MDLTVEQALRLLTRETATPHRHLDEIVFLSCVPFGVQDANQGMRTRSALGGQLAIRSVGQCFAIVTTGRVGSDYVTSVDIEGVSGDYGCSYRRIAVRCGESVVFRLREVVLTRLGNDWCDMVDGVDGGFRAVRESTVSRNGQR